MTLNINRAGAREIETNLIFKIDRGNYPTQRRKGAKVLFNNNLHHRYFTWAGGQKERVERTVAEPRPTGLDGGNGWDGGNGRGGWLEAASIVAVHG